MADLPIESSRRLDQLSARLSESVRERRVAVRSFVTRVALVGAGTYTVAEAVTAVTGNEASSRNAALAMGATLAGALAAAVWEAAENGPDVLFGGDVRSTRRQLAAYQGELDVQCEQLATV